MDDKTALEQIKQLKADYEATLQPRPIALAESTSITPGTEDRPITFWQAATLIYWAQRWKLPVHRCNDSNCIVNLSKAQASAVHDKLRPMKDKAKADAVALKAAKRKLNKEILRGKLFDD